MNTDEKSVAFSNRLFQPLKVFISAINGENLEAEKALITTSNLQWNHVDRRCQLWQVSYALTIS
jgi:hypothetical protein